MRQWGGFDGGIFMGGCMGGGLGAGRWMGGGFFFWGEGWDIEIDERAGISACISS